MPEHICHEERDALHRFIIGDCPYDCFPHRRFMRDLYGIEGISQNIDAVVQRLVDLILAHGLEGVMPTADRLRTLADSVIAMAKEREAQRTRRVEDIARHLEQVQMQRQREREERMDAIAQSLFEPRRIDADSPRIIVEVVPQEAQTKTRPKQIKG